MIYFRYDYHNLLLTHIKGKKGEKLIKDGIDVKNFTESDEWHVINVNAQVTSEKDDLKKGVLYPGLKNHEK